MVTNRIHINATACCTQINHISEYTRNTPFTFASMKRRLQPYMHVQNRNPRGSRLIMDDGRPFGPGTTDTSSASKRDPALQSPGAAPLPLRTPNLRSERNLPSKMLDFSLVPVSKSWLPSVPLRSLYVMLPGWVEKTRSYLIYLAGPLHIRLPVSAAPHTLFSVC